MISATLDSSVYVRAFNFGGRAAKVLSYARAREIRIDISKAILDETIGVLREIQGDPYTLHDIRQKLTATHAISSRVPEPSTSSKKTRMTTVFWSGQKQRIRTMLSRKIRIYSV